MSNRFTGVLNPVSPLGVCSTDVLDSMRKRTRTKNVQDQGIYFLVKGMYVDYVGKTSNLYDRLSKHHRLKYYHKVSFLPVLEKDKLDMLENHYIQAFQPRLNVKGNR